MSRYAVSAVIYSYVEVEAENREEANNKAKNGDFIRLLNPDVAEVFDAGDVNGPWYNDDTGCKTCTIEEFMSGACYVTYDEPAKKDDVGFIISGGDYSIKEAELLLSKEKVGEILSLYSDVCDETLGRPIFSQVINGRSVIIYPKNGGA